MFSGQKMDRLYSTALSILLLLLSSVPQVVSTRGREADAIYAPEMRNSTRMSLSCNTPLKQLPKLARGRTA